MGRGEFNGWGEGGKLFPRRRAVSLREVITASPSGRRRPVDANIVSMLSGVGVVGVFMVSGMVVVEPSGVWVILKLYWKAKLRL